MQNHLKNELHDLISGKSQVRFGTLIQTVTSYLKYGSKTDSKDKGTKQIREQETKKLEVFISENNLWVEHIDFSQYVSEGAEQRVFFKDSEYYLNLMIRFITVHGKIIFTIFYYTIFSLQILPTN